MAADLLNPDRLLNYFPKFLKIKFEVTVTKKQKYDAFFWNMNIGNSEKPIGKLFNTV